MGADFKLNPNFEEEFTNSDIARDQLLEIGPGVVQRTKNMAPNDPKTSSDKVIQGISFDVIKHPATRSYVGRLLSKNWKSRLLIEGTKVHRPRPFIRQAVEAEGFKITKPIGE